MPEFAWRRRTTRHFGEQWTPFAELSLRARSGRWHTFAAQVDTGAVISVLPRSVADLLGARLADGTEIDLSGVGGPPRRYRVLKVPARLGADSEFEIRIAFAETEDVPSLLGRVDVLERYQIDLDCSLEQTRISAPWLDRNWHIVWRVLLEVDDVLTSRWADHPLRPPLDAACLRFVGRANQIVGAAAGLAKLHRGFEMMSLLRPAFELSLQFEYLMRNPVERAQLYLDYEHVIRYEQHGIWCNLPGVIGDGLRGRPTAVADAARIQQAYERVRRNYLPSPRATKVRRHWYPGTLRDLARGLNREREYEAMYGMFSAWSHGDPWGSQLNVHWTSLSIAWGYWARILLRIANEKEIVLTHKQFAALDNLAQQMAW